jgi:arylsulfatase A-like enzyme
MGPRKYEIKVALLFLFYIISFAQPSTSQPPNIVVILADDQGWGDLGLTGNQAASTPNIDQMAKRGAFFNHFYVSPVCSPTRAEFLTGRYHLRGGVNGVASGKERLNLDEVTIADIFKKRGYATGLFGKWHNGAQGPYHPNARGFQEFYGFTIGHLGNYFDPQLQMNGKIVQAKGFITDNLTQHGLDFIEQNQKKPFLAYFAFNTPHSPMQVPDEYWQKYKDKMLVQKGTLPNKEDIEHTKAGLAMNENLDWNVGKIIQLLEKLNLIENTIIVYFSDNGPNGNRWNAGMKGIKGSTDEGGIRSPLIIQWKNTIKASQKIENLSGSIDLLPTLLGLSGVEYKTIKSFDGVNLTPLLMGQNPSALQNRFIPTYWNGKTSIRTAAYRLDASNQLYDMIRDTAQTTDVAKIYPASYNDILFKKKQWENEVVAALPIKDERPLLVGDPLFINDVLPASEANARGNIVRSSIHPNDSYYKQWRSTEDSILWDIEVLEKGEFEIEFYYACSEKNIGTKIELSFQNSSVTKPIIVANDVPLLGVQKDRVKRDESFLKDFKPLNLGRIILPKGKGVMSAKATILNAADDLEFYMIRLQRIK